MGSESSAADGGEPAGEPHVPEHRVCEPRKQVAIVQDPYDRWTSPNGTCVAEFYRDEDGFRLRFPHQADFLLKPNATPGKFAISAYPVPDCPPPSVQTLLANAIQPLIGNYTGGLFLHGSAVAITGEDGETIGATAFLGLSRGGKTTLAGAFAKAGHPFLTEDVIDLRLDRSRYVVQPKASKLRLFEDSARHLIGDDTRFPDANAKRDVEGGNAIPFAAQPVPLTRIFVLGTDRTAPLSIELLPPSAALSALLPHAFVLDVEDKPRLAGHFSRIADLIDAVGCHILDYPRTYDELPRVIETIIASITPT